MLQILVILSNVNELHPKKVKKSCSYFKVITFKLLPVTEHSEPHSRRESCLPVRQDWHVNHSSDIGFTEKSCWFSLQDTKLIDNGKKENSLSILSQTPTPTLTE